MKLQPKLMLSMAAAGLLAVLVSMVVALSLGNQAIEHEVEQKIKAVLDARHFEISEYMLRLQRDDRMLEVDPTVADALRDFTRAFAERGDKAQAQLQQAWIAGNPHPADERMRLTERSDRSLYDRAHVRHHPSLREKVETRVWGDLLLVDPKGNIVYSVKKGADFATNLVTGPWKNTGLARAVLPLLDKPVAGVPAFTDVADYPPSDRPAGFYAMPILDPVDGFLGVIVIQMSTARINRIMQQRVGLGESGETFLVGREGWMLSDSRFEKTSTILKKQLKTAAVDRVLEGQTGLIAALDYRGVPVYVGFRPIQVFPNAIGGDVRWGVIAKIDRAEALTSIANLRASMLVVGLLIALLAIAGGILVGRTVSRPILAIKQALADLSEGKETTVPGLERTDEIGAMARAAETFRELAEQTERNHWIREGVASLTGVISAEASMERAPELLLSRLCELLEVPVAAIYIDDGEGGYRRASSHGLARRNQAEDHFALGEGLVGQCAKDRHPVVLSPLPGGLTAIAAGLAEFPPKELVFYPIPHKDEVLAVVELASLVPLTPRQHELLEEASTGLGLHLANLRAAEHNLALLAESRKLTAELEQQQIVLSDRNASLQNLTEELKSQTEELKAQAEEMKAQAEELKANQEELRAQQEEMAHKNQVLEAQGRQLESARQEAEAKALELERASQYKSEFLANMSHELRTPLNSILILAKSLSENEDANLTPDQAESATVIHESGSHLLTLINDILDLSKIEAGRLEIMPEDFPLDDLLAYLRRVFAPLAEKKGIAFAIDVDADVPGAMHGDRQRITQVLTNLMSNAVKFTEAGSVRVGVKRDGDRLRIDVVDTGIGIPPEKLEHVFGVFQQLDGTTSRKYGGSGLGLAISRRLAELMGGEIVATSVPGEGSCFSVRLPHGPAAQSAPRAPAARPPSPAPRKAGPAAPAMGRILVVEDDNRLVSILERLIDTLGYPVTCVESGEKALSSVAADRPAGILLDLGLPGISGMEVLRRIKADPVNAGIPVFIMSGASDTGEAKTLGAVGFLKKPVTRDMIAAALGTMRHLSAQAALRQVLVVEDDASTVKALHRLFQHDPVELIPVANGRAAFDLLGTRHFDAVILDLSLEDMSGFEWLDKVCAEGRPHPPIVIYSARELTKEELLSLRACTETVVTKGRHANERLREEVLLALNAPSATHQDAPLQAPEAGHHLLLVDDDVRNLFALSKALRGRGFSVTVAEDGAKALEALRAGRFDAVLTDIMMPGIDGYELIRRIRDLGYADLPIIAVTAKAMQGDRELCLQAGANAYIAKPVDIDRLVDLLREPT